ncbi:hypothetical protein CRG98_018070 [Punica granatum]|uniref:Uncharacterized protein n=1 Tax=Punica granatum TaxID=22663 RepID=A0A2I0JZ12_PUNGR|nr:hypothetical protein CRG98_018070 [Punica granatum]
MGRSCDDERQVEAMVAPRTSSSRDKSGGLEIELIKDSSSCLKARGVESSVQPISKEALYVGSSSQKEMSNSSPEVRELKQSDHKPKSSLCKAEIVSPSNARGVGMNLATHEEKPELLKSRVPEVTSWHFRPPFITVHMFGVPVSKVMVDNDAVVNVMPTSTMTKLNRTKEDLVKKGVMIMDFKGVMTNARVVLSVDIQVSSTVITSTFIVVDASASYNALLG